MWVPAGAGVRARNARGFRTAAGAVVDGKVGGCKGAELPESKKGLDGQVRSFEEIPHTGRNSWVNLLRFWREDRFRHLHKHMERTFNSLGPIYRYHVPVPNLDVGATEPGELDLQKGSQVMIKALPRICVCVCACV